MDSLDYNKIRTEHLTLDQIKEKYGEEAERQATDWLKQQDKEFWRKYHEDFENFLMWGNPRKLK